MTAHREVLITGGAGFIGTNLANRLAGQGRRVLIFDNLARPGAGQNVRWLQQTHGGAIRFMQGDTRDRGAVNRAVARASAVFHFAAQVAVTTSLSEPFADFETNALGTVNLLEALRQLASPPPIVYTSTNKVYGGLSGVPLQLADKRYEPVDAHVRATGIDESRPLDFCTPYGCSKGCADQYVLDYARSFGIPACVFRMSCIYGPHQFGTEDQGWVAHFLIRARENSPITIYGDGYQVRDILFVEDLVDAFLLAQGHLTKGMADICAGQAFNIGGGPRNTVSLHELLGMIRELRRGRPEIRFENARTGDQRYYVSNTSKFAQATGWSPRVSPQEGVRALNEWLTESRPMTNAPPVTSESLVMSADR